ncbi:MAG: methyltransferase domain-containing protein [Cyanobacteria bacterium P01_H01_bin.35]
MNNQTTEKEIILEEFNKLTKFVKPPMTSLENIKSIFKLWLSFNFTRLMQRIGFNRKKIKTFSEKSQIILNIGCAGDEKEEYINADVFRVFGDWGFASIRRFLLGNRDKTRYDLFLNLTELDQDLLGIADFIILSHVLEHIHPQYALVALKNCFDYLKIGGYIRLAVPFLDAYNTSNLPECQKLTYPILAKNRLIYGWGHCFMYDAVLLKFLLEEAGFSEVEQVNFGSGILGETDVAEYRQESIYLKGKKLN